MIERVARAIFAHSVSEHICDGTWEDAENHALHQTFREEARAAIEVMREATVSMSAVGADTLRQPKGPFPADDVWADMIQEALR